MVHTMTLSQSITNMITVKPSTIDDFASIRYLHRLSVKVLGTAYHSDMELAARMALIETGQYAKELLYQKLQTAWIQNELVGTSGWTEHDPTEKSAYITSIYTHPLFAREGIGSMMLKKAETSAREAGFTTLMVRANLNASSFFTARGYELIVHDTEAAGTEIFLPVAIMQKQVKPILNDKDKKRQEKESESEGETNAHPAQHI